ncbi:hypothetical protein CDL15_Pgr020923 [Punica granatum]|uniref:Uncharacterized protein n=1 Tax=Punica granatum TaxID=22663 RepID=A0A218XWI7_PUNGR|nr:hypothetical protein CDL15_Pgr020923 [Punica granatum]
MAIQAELANLRAERDRLRREVAEKNEQLGDQHQLQKAPVESSTSSEAPVPEMAIQAELANLRAERDRLRREVAEKNEQLGDQHQLQK